MRVWVREWVGWFLVALGLATFYICYEFLLVNHIIEVGPLVFIGFILFRGGIHLLKVSVAAQICLQAEKRLGENRPPAPAPNPPRRRPGQPAPARRTT